MIDMFEEIVVGQVDEFKHKITEKDINVFSKSAVTCCILVKVFAQRLTMPVSQCVNYTDIQLQTVHF